MVTAKSLLKLEKLGGAEPANRFGHCAQKPKTTFVEGIWSVEYCRQNPQNASQAIQTLQLTLQDRDDEIARKKATLTDLTNELRKLAKEIECI